MPGLACFRCVLRSCSTYRLAALRRRRWDHQVGSRAAHRIRNQYGAPTDTTPDRSDVTHSRVIEKPAMPKLACACCGSTACQPNLPAGATSAGAESITVSRLSCPRVEARQISVHLPLSLSEIELT